MIANEMKKIAQFISMEFSLFWNGKISLPWMYWFWGIVVWNLIKFGTIFLVAEPFPLILYIGVPYALVLASLCNPNFFHPQLPAKKRINAKSINTSRPPTIPTPSVFL